MDNPGHYDEYPELTRADEERERNRKAKEPDMNTTNTKIAGEAMTDEQIAQTAAPFQDDRYGAISFCKINDFARALLASKGAVPLTTGQIDAIRERFHADDMPSRGLVQRIAMLAAPAQSRGDAEQADEAVALPMLALLAKVPRKPNAITYEKGWELLDELQRVAESIAARAKDSK